MSVKDKVDAIDRFVRTLKAESLWDDIGTACVLAGWENVDGCVTALKGTDATPTAFSDADVDAGIGMKGDGTSKYLDSNRANNADGQSDHHSLVFVSSPTESGGPGFERFFGVYETALSPSTATNLYQTSAGVYAGFSRNNISFIQGTAIGVGIAGISRGSPSSFSLRIAGSTQDNNSSDSYTPSSLNSLVFCGNLNGVAWRHTNARLSWYSIGSATDLAAMDTAVSALMTDLRSIDEQGMDRDALRYIRAVEAADGSFLETPVKRAINALVEGLKQDVDANGRSAWDAIGASCLLCGPRTLAGALVPLRGDAPTNVADGFVSGDYNRETGLVGDGSTTYLDSGRANDADGQDDAHQSVYVSSAGALAKAYIGGVDRSTPESASFILIRGTGTILARINSDANSETAVFSGSGFLGVARSSASSQTTRADGVDVTDNFASTFLNTRSNFVFARDDADGTPDFSDARLAFYSIGASLDLSALDRRISDYVTAISAAL